MSNTNYNPLLVHAITNVDLSDIPASPPIKLLPGKYAQLVAANHRKIPLEYPKNVQMLIWAFFNNSVKGEKYYD